jgi:serine protease inhibitor
VSGVYQRVAVRWDEKGADLAAATSVSGVGISLVTVKPIAFDHPFVFAVVERETGLILFQGRVADPRNFSQSP